MSDPSNPDNYPPNPPNIPASDWPGFAANQFPNFQGQISDATNRLGVLPGYREEPLQEPYIIWDSRTLSATDSVLHNNGTAGELFDLKLGTEYNERDNHPYTTLFPTSYMYGYKTRNWDNSFATTPDPPGGFPTGQDDIGGDTCQGAYTMMIAFAPTFRQREIVEAELIARGATDPEAYMYIEVDFLSNYDTADGGGVSLCQNVIGDNDASGTDPESTDIFHEWYDRLNYCQWFQATPSPTYVPHPIEGQPIAGKLITYVVDTWMGTYHVWNDTTLVKFYDIWGDYEPPGFENYDYNFIDWIMPCWYNTQGNLNPGEFRELFLHFYGHETQCTLYVDGGSWANMVGVAFFRGRPSEADLEYWHSYFYPPNQAYQPIAMINEITRDGLANTDPHSSTFIVPDNGYDPEHGLYPVNKVTLELIYARGGSQREDVRNSRRSAVFAEINVNPGDEITIELGGQGQDYRQSGLGGWPDGGNGGLSSTNGTYGGGGGGSTRIYLNGQLYIHMPGGGGGAASSVSGGPSTVDEYGLPPSLPETGGFDAPTSSGAYMGQGATTSAPGAGGTGGGTSGSGNNGGTGTTTTPAVKTGGGGGGGGVFGGGGGGATGPITCGGAAGSWYFHPNVSYYSGVSAGQAAAPSIPAEVIIYYW